MTKLLTRRLSDASALLVGRVIATAAEDFEKQHGPLPAHLAPLFVEFSAATTALQLEDAKTDAELFVFDRVADRTLSSFYRAIEAQSTLYSGDELLPLTAAQKAAREAAESLLAIAFPNGTSFLKLPYGAQFLAMEKLAAALAEPGPKAAVATLGIEPGAARIAAVTKAYGGFLGIGQPVKGPGSSVPVNDAWHEAYEALLFGVIGAFQRTPHNDAATAAFLTPYTTEVERLRGAERKSRRAKKNGD